VEIYIDKTISSSDMFIHYSSNGSGRRTGCWRETYRSIGAHRGFVLFRTLCTLLYHCTRVGECRIVYVIHTFLGRKEWEKKRQRSEFFPTRLYLEI
jgi:hypothetical protein